MEHDYIVSHRDARKHVLRKLPNILVGYASLIFSLYVMFLGDVQFVEYDLLFIAFLIGTILSVFVIIYDMRKAINKLSNAHYVIAGNSLIQHLGDGSQVTISIVDLDKIKVTKQHILLNGVFEKHHIPINVTNKMDLIDQIKRVAKMN